MHFDVIIIGAGAAGLAAMDKLTMAGFKVCLLEAREIAGGRIATQVPNSFGFPIETGAEFIHGECPVTKELLSKANIEYTEVRGKMIMVRNGAWFDDEDDGQNPFELLTEKKKELKADCTIRDFLDAYLPATAYDEIRKGVINFAEGFSLADINRASVLAFFKEWEETGAKQYRVTGGYQQMIDCLVDWCTLRGGEIHLNDAVHRVEYGNGRVTAYTSQNKQYQASKLIVTVSAGVLQSGDIIFVPGLGTHAGAIQQLGFGSVIKLIFLFDDAFWFTRDRDIGFLLTDEPIPTWWTQLPNNIPVLTGWLGGPKATLMSSLSDDNIFETGLSSLANMFGIEISLLRRQLVSYKIMRWDNYSFVKGGYSYTTINSAKAISVLQRPIDDTIYFAGEAIYSGDLGGTVEAALVSGSMAAGMIMGKHSYVEK